MNERKSVLGHTLEIPYMKSQPNEKEAERAISALIETYRQGFLHLDPEQIASIWDMQHEPLIYVAQEMKEPA
jgi:hypothetical protein